MSEENEGKPEAELGAPAPKKKAKAESSESVKDRNQRIREEAAARRRGKREEERRRAAPARNLDASEIVDDALARGTHNLAQLLKKHFNKIQWAAAVIIVGGIGYKVYTVRAKRVVGDNSDKLVAAIGAERGRIGQGESSPNSPTGINDARKHFASDEARLKAAAEAYQRASEAGGNSGTLARLGQAGILFDQAKYQEALKAYQDVRDSKLATKDQDVKARAIEGVGLSQEALGQIEPALKAFRELENSGITGFGPLGQFHQARLLRAKGENDKAKELVQKALKKLDEKAKERAPGMPPSYLQTAARELLSMLDPQAAAATSSIKNIDPAVFDKLGKEPGDQGVDAAKLQELLKQVQEAATGSPETPAPPEQQQAPAPPASAP
jgi:tetratricopeptide (TPR) repeat protein